SAAGPAAGDRDGHLERAEQAALAGPAADLAEREAPGLEVDAGAVWIADRAAGRPGVGREVGGHGQAAVACPAEARVGGGVERADADRVARAVNALGLLG